VSETGDDSLFVVGLTVTPNSDGVTYFTSTISQFHKGIHEVDKAN